MKKILTEEIILDLKIYPILLACEKQLQKIRLIVYSTILVYYETSHKGLNDGNFTNARFIQVNQLPQIDSHLTAKPYVDNGIMNSLD